METGLYWVRLHTGQWTVAECTLRGWQFIGDEHEFSHDDAMRLVIAGVGYRLDPDCELDRRA